MTLNWNPGKFKAALTADLLANAELVGKVVATDAKARLLALPDLDTTRDGKPYKGGASYRAYVASLMGYDVTMDGEGVLIRVGVGSGRGGSHHGLYIELGSRTTGPRPFLRPAVFENADQIVRLLAGK